MPARQHQCIRQPAHGSFQWCEGANRRSTVLQWRGKYITIHYCDVQWQVGGNDCGIFEIAFATAICSGDEPASIVFDQNNMRKHLKTCFDNGELTPFPERSRKRRIKAAKENTLPVHCTCRLPDRGDLMIQCAKCKTWYHTTCVNIPKSFLRKNTTFVAVDHQCSPAV